MARRTITVPLGGAQYDVHVGLDLLGELPAILARACPAERYALIADATVAARYGARVGETIRGFRPCDTFTFPAGEGHKTRAQWAALSDAMLAAGVGRDAAIVALGGGVTGDLAGFVAATYLRGIPYVQVPTTLLAMIDAAVGGKTGVDTPHGKNLIGAFHQPRAVVADVRTLASLPAPHLASGAAEALKHGAIADARYFEAVVARRREIMDADPDALVEVVARSVEIKAAVVGEDEREHGKRAILNFGHTVGHAVEAATGYAMLHGEAIGVGMVIEARLGTALGVTDAAVEPALRRALEAFGLPTAPPNTARSGLLQLMAQDKKARGGTVKFALLKALGQPARQEGGDWTHGAAPEAVDRALQPTRPNSIT